MTAATQEVQLVPVDADTLSQWQSEGGTVLIDVREAFEHAAERIDPSQLHALSSLDVASLREQCADSRVVFYCRTGKRSADAALRFASNGEEVYHLRGGIQEWKQRGLETHKSASAPKLDVMRQVQVTAGSLMLIGIVGGQFVTEWFFLLSAFVGCGLIFAGLSGWCGMAKLLGAMPWNRITPAT